jgi:hypothetical protein
MRKRPRIKKTESERRIFKPFSQRSMVRRSQLLCSSAEFQRQRVTLIRFIASFFFYLQSLAFWHFRWQKTTSFNDSENKKKIDWVSPGFGRVDPVPGRPGFPRPIPERVFASTRTGPRPGSVGSRVDPPCRSGFKTLIQIYYNYVKKLKFMFMS